MDRATVNQQIEKILRSQSFASKSQLRKLLEVLGQSYDSPGTLKPDQVIRELWPQEVKTKGSGDVAAEINRLRRALNAYYRGEGSNDPVTILLPNRSASAADGRQEKRWIAARPRGVDDRLPLSKLSPRRILIVATALTAVCVATLIVVRVLAGHVPPQLARLDGSTLTIMNAEGKELWKKVFPQGFDPDWYYAQGVSKMIWFGDLEGKGHTSVLFSYSSAAPEPHSSTLICYSDRGTEKWRWTPGRELPELAGSPATYKTHALAVLKATATKPARIVVDSQHNPWWPSQIALLDSHGKLISEYWHSGALTSMALGDLDGDGREEILLAGASEYDHQATLVVLDPDKVFGASTEERSEFQIHGMGTAQERLRLLFPRSDLNRAMYQYDQATEPTFEHGITRLTVLECITPPGCRIWYEFDKDFHLMVAFAGGDEFRSAHARFYQNGKAAHPLSDEEQAAFQRVRCLVGCRSDYVAVGKLVP